jgi:hypothetical protein
MTDDQIIFVIFALVLAIVLPLSIMLLIIFLSERRTKRIQQNMYYYLRHKYQTDCVGTLCLYSGLPLPSYAICEVAFCGDTLHIVHGHFWKAIRVTEIDNIWIDTYQEGYTRQSVYGIGLIAGIGMVGSAIGNASRKSNAKKTLLFISCRSGIIAFHKDTFDSFVYLPPYEKLQLQNYNTKFCISNWIIHRFAEEKRKQYKYQ